MAKSLIFVSCGQGTDPEKALGVQIKEAIDGTDGLDAYFAETVQDLDALGANILDALLRCQGAVVVLHDRGVVSTPDGGEWGHRSSVWINQEVAILAYRQFVESKKIPILALADESVKLEGAMTSLIVNPRPLRSNEDALAALKAWLASSEFGGGSDASFLRKWERLTAPARQALAALVDEGGSVVKEMAVRDAITARFGVQREEASRAMAEARPLFIATDLVKVVDNIHSGDEMSIHPTWEQRVRRNIGRWLKEQGHET